MAASGKPRGEKERARGISGYLPDGWATITFDAPEGEDARNISDKVAKIIYKEIAREKKEAGELGKPENIHKFWVDLIEKSGPEELRGKITPRIAELLENGMVAELLVKYKNNERGWFANGLYAIASRSRNSEFIDNIYGVANFLGKEVAAHIAGDVADYLVDHAGAGKKREAAEKIRKAFVTLEKTSAIVFPNEIGALSGQTVFATLFSVALHVDEISAVGAVSTMLNAYSERNIPVEMTGLLFTLTSKVLGESRYIFRANELVKKFGGAAVGNFKKVVTLPFVIADDLDLIVKNEHDLYATLAYLGSARPVRLFTVKDNLVARSVIGKGNKEHLPRPSPENLKDYETIANVFMRDNFAIENNMTIEEIAGLLSLNKGDLEAVIRAHLGSAETSKRIYQIGSENEGQLAMKEGLMENAIRAIVGSRDKAREAEAFKITADFVKMKNLNRAKSRFNEKFRSKRGMIVSAFNRDQCSVAFDALMSLEEGPIRKVGDMLNEVASKFGSTPEIQASETKDPLAYNEHDLLACSFLPFGSSREEGIVNYTKDPNVILVKYSARDETIGSAICYLEADKFLVDSVEGSVWMRNSAVCSMVHQDLVNRALEKGAAQIIFNRNVSNGTAKRFLEHLIGREGLMPSEVKMRLRTRSYLEAKESRKEVSALIENVAPLARKD